MFPDLIGSDYSFEFGFSNGSFFQAGDNRSTRFKKSLRPRYSFDLGWRFLTLAEAESLRTLVLQTQAGANEFEWFSWPTMYWRWVKLGVSNGINRTYVMPAKGTSEQFFYADGNIGINGTVALGVGPNGEDEVTLDAPADLGRVVTASFLGRRKFLCRFDIDVQTDNAILLDNDRFVYNTSITEVR